jgi:hypothetical protein
MNSAILRKALRNNAEKRITKELSIRLGEYRHRDHWEYHGDPPTISGFLDEGGTITVIDIRTKRRFEFEFYTDGDMHHREVMEWRWN